MVAEAALRLTAVLLGLLLAFRGWNLHVRHIETQGFIAGAIFGGSLTYIATRNIVLVLIVGCLLGFLGAMVALKIEYFVVIASGSATGMIVSLGIYFFIQSPVIVVLLIVLGGYLAWVYYKNFIVFSTALGGAVLTAIGIGSGGFGLLIFLFGLLTQHGVISIPGLPTTSSDDESIYIESPESSGLSRVGDIVVDSGAPIPIKVFTALIIFINITVAVGILLTPITRPGVDPAQPTQRELFDLFATAVISTVILLPITIGLWRLNKIAWYGGIIVFSLSILVSALLGSAGGFLSAITLLLLLYYRKDYLNDKSPTFKKIAPDDLDRE